MPLVVTEGRSPSYPHTVVERSDLTRRVTELTRKPSASSNLLRLLVGIGSGILGFYLNFIYFKFIFMYVCEFA